MSEAIIINLFGAPGAGKSTAASYIFAMLKMAGINAELVTEFAKDKVYEGNKAVFENQAYIFGKQYFKISRCANKVDVIVTDSPLLLSLVYNKSEILGEEFNALVRKVVASQDTRNYYLTRLHKYDHNGRFQDEDGANAVGQEILTTLMGEGVTFTALDSTTANYDRIVREVVEEIKGE